MSDQGTLSGKCPRCGVTAEAIILASGGALTTDLGTTSRAAYFCRCPGCKKEFLAEQYAYLPPLYQMLEDMDTRNEGKEKHAKNWEVRVPIEHVDGIPDLPSVIGQFYGEAVACLANNLPNAAGAMFRKTLEAATVDNSLVALIPDDKREKYESGTLYARISALKAAGAIPPALYSVADVLRTEGNVAVHDVESYSLEEASALKAFADAFLNNTITLPRMIAATRSATTKAKGK